MPTNLPNGLMERTACEDESVVVGSVIVPEHPVGKTVRSRRVTLPLRNCAVKTYLRSLVRLVWLDGGRCSRVFRDARSEERRVGKECRSRWAGDSYKKTEQ